MEKNWEKKRVNFWLLLATNVLGVIIGELIVYYLENRKKCSCEKEEKCCESEHREGGDYCNYNTDEDTDEAEDLPIDRDYDDERNSYSY